MKRHRAPNDHEQNLSFSWARLPVDIVTHKLIPFFTEADLFELRECGKLFRKAYFNYDRDTDVNFTRIMRLARLGRVFPKRRYLEAWPIEFFPLQLRLESFKYISNHCFPGLETLSIRQTGGRPNAITWFPSHNNIRTVIYGQMINLAQLTQERYPRLEKLVASQFLGNFRTIPSHENLRFLWLGFSSSAHIASREWSVLNRARFPKLEEVNCCTDNRQNEALLLIKRDFASRGIRFNVQKYMDYFHLD